MKKKKVPLQSWCFAAEHAAEMWCLTATRSHQLYGWTPFEHMMGFTPSISKMIEHEWYGWVWYWCPVQKDNALGRWLGLAHDVGQGLCSYILTRKAEPIVRSTVMRLSEEDRNNKELREEKDKFD
eukprot:1647717-Ditylum_brightwellii.AAC.1